MKIDELKSKLIEMSGQLVDKIEHEPDEDMCVLLMIQSRVCLIIAKDRTKLKTLYKNLSDGEHVLVKLDE